MMKREIITHHPNFFILISTFAWRYFKAKKSTNAINIIAWVSVTAITIGTASLIIILSAFNGFESLVRSLYSSFYPDIRISPKLGKTFILTAEQYKKITSINGVKAVSLVIEEKALLKNGELQTVVSIKGVDDQYPKVSGVPSNMFRGKFDLGNAASPKLVLGVGIENAVGVLSDRTLAPLSIYLPKKGVNDMVDPLNGLAVGEVMPAGSFAIQQEFDNGYALTNLSFLKENMGYGENEFSAVEIRVSNNNALLAIQDAIKKLVGEALLVQSRVEQNRSLYTTIRVEKWVIYGIFSLILLVGAFTMVGALTMLVLEKKQDIYILKALGADRSLIRRIFLAEGVLLAGIGALSGIMIALILYYLQINYKLVPLQGQSFLIDYYPVTLVVSDFILVSLTVIGIGALASWIPAYRSVNISE
ncbi:MAG: FtsX-like permease family protein [Sphingobacteriales bacterium]|jgi:lipoprotein-releasing system permease protein